MARFRASQGGVTARFGAAQARIVRDLVGQVAELLGADPETGESPGADGSAARLEAGFGRPTRPSRGTRCWPGCCRTAPGRPEAAGSSAAHRAEPAGRQRSRPTVLGTLPARGGRAGRGAAGRRGVAAGTERRVAGLGVRSRHRRLRGGRQGINPVDPRAAYVGLPLAGLTPGRAWSRRCPGGVGATRRRRSRSARRCAPGQGTPGSTTRTRPGVAYRPGPIRSASSRWTTRWSPTFYRFTRRSSCGSGKWTTDEELVVTTIAHRDRGVPVAPIFLRQRARRALRTGLHPGPG